MIGLDKNLPSFFHIDQNVFSIGYSKKTNSYSMSVNHNHNTYEIYYLLSGERYYFIKDRNYHIKAGDIVLINTYNLHSTSSTPNSSEHERILVHINENFLSSIVQKHADIDLFSCFKKDINVLRTNEKSRRFLETLLFDMIDVYNDYKSKTSKSAEFYLKIMAAELLVYINNNEDLRVADVGECPSKVHKKVFDIINYINSNYMNDISLKTVSSYFFLSKFYTARIFKEITGQTFTEYLNTVRIMEAKRLLKETNLSVLDICQKVGFENSSYFSVIFKNYVGCSPLQYRRGLA